MNSESTSQRGWMWSAQCAFMLTVLIILGPSTRLVPLQRPRATRHPPTSSQLSSVCQHLAQTPIGKRKVVGLKPYNTELANVCVFQKQQRSSMLQRRYIWKVYWQPMQPPLQAYFLLLAAINIPNSPPSDQWSHCSKNSSFSQVTSLMAITHPHLFQNINQLSLTQSTTYSWYIFIFWVRFLSCFQKPVFSQSSANKLAENYTGFSSS